MTLRGRTRPTIALALCLALIMVAPAASFSSAGADGAVAAKKKCRKGTKLKKKRCVPVKKKAPATAAVPADGTYVGTDGVTIIMSTQAGKRYVVARATVAAATCPATGTVFPVTLSTPSVPLFGLTFKSGSTSSISGTFLSASRVHVITQATDFSAAPGVLCSGTADVTTDIHPA